MVLWFYFQAKSSIIVKDISVTGGTLGRREITFQFSSMKDYVRIESVAGPPAKLKFIDLDPEQVCFLHHTHHHIHLSRIMRKPTFRFPTGSDTNQAVHLQKMARGLKFRIYKVEGLYYLCGENKGVISFAVTAKPICVFVFAYAKCSFSRDAAHHIHFKALFSSS